MSVPEEVKGCTVGVVQTPGGVLMFKNRDLSQEYILNRTTVFQSTPEFHFLKGVNIKTKGLEGVSIGVNKHKVCVANTHIWTSPDVTYDVLCEKLVQEAAKKEDVPGIVEEFMRRHTVQGGRILVAAPGWTYLVEVLRKTFKLSEVAGSFAITNHFSLISHEQEGLPGPGKSSLTRLETAQAMMKGMSSLRALKAMLRSRLPEKGGTSICNHGAGGGTESSHIIQIQGDYVAWSSLFGNPCENDYHAIPLFQS